MAIIVVMLLEQTMFKAMMIVMYRKLVFSHNRCHVQQTNKVHSHYESQVAQTKNVHNHYVGQIA